LSIDAAYYRNVTGELDKAAQTYQLQMDSYPRSSAAYNNLGLVSAQMGNYEKAVEMTRHAIDLDSDVSVYYQNLTTYTMALQHFDETRQMIRQAQARKIDPPEFHVTLYQLAFVNGDSATMAEEQKWLAAKPDYENWSFSLSSDTEVYVGRVGNARELIKQAVASAMRADDKESGAIDLANSALQRAAYGNTAEAQRSAAEALKLAPGSPGVTVIAALAYAQAGDTARAESLAQDLTKRYPLGTQMQTLWLPAIHALLAIQRKNPAQALDVLQSASTHELGLIPFTNNTSCLFPVYVRGQAFLSSGQGAAASAEFKKVIDHSGIVATCWTGALARLGSARANALQAKTAQGADADAARVRALTAYKEFFNLWKDADPGVPILTQAKGEFARLQ
jgi:tetratricopeptide (TPR) repeat protein